MSGFRLILFLFFLAPVFAAAGESAVYAIRNENAIAGFRERPAVVRSMVELLVLEVTGQKEVDAAWRSLVKPSDRVGIKISTEGGYLFSSHESVVEAVVSGIRSAGVPRGNISIWGRAAEFDPKAVFSSPRVGRLIWGDLQFPKPTKRKLVEDSDRLSNESHWGKGLEALTVIINLPVLSSSEDVGVAGAIYNATIPNLDNWRRFVQGPDFGDPYLCELYADPRIGPKVALTIMDGLIGQYAGGPGFDPNYAFHHHTLYASRDAVAIDAVALERIETWRKQAGLPSLARRARYIQSAEAMGLGVADSSVLTEVKP